MKKITVADIIESMEVHLLPPSVQENAVARIYKLLIKFKSHDFISLEDLEETLTHAFLRQLEDAIQKHVDLLYGIGGIMNSTPGGCSDEVETYEDGSVSHSHGGERDKDGDDDGDDDGCEETAEDLGSDMKKRKQQTTDEMDYEEGSEDETVEGDSATEVEKERRKANQSHDGSATVEDEVLSDADNEMLYGNGEMKEPKSSDKRAKPKARKKKGRALEFKEKDRRVFVEVNGLSFEVHFRFTGEPHLLLGQVLSFSYPF